MIPPPQQRGALQALNTVLVLLRSLAYDGVTGEELADLLDMAEYLPRLLAEEPDRTREYRETLMGLAERRDDFQLAVERFDHPSDTW